MNGSKILGFEFGEVELLRKPHSKYIRIKVHPEKGVVVTIPQNYTEQQAVDFVLKKAAWIKKALEKTTMARSKLRVFREGTEFRTRYHSLRIEKHYKPGLKVNVGNKLISVWYPENKCVEDEGVQDFIRHSITEALKIEAKHYLPQRTYQLAKQNKLKCGEVKVRNNKTRWGSCSGSNNISLNIHLMRLPDVLIDYVILHELAHIRHKNHSVQFWAYLETICNGAGILDKELNNYHLIYW